MSVAAAVARPTGRRTRLRGPAATALVVGAATLALQVRDPHRHGSWGFCPFRLLTGWDCPGCGGLRAVNDLGHGDLLAAAHSNLLLVASIPLAAGFWLLWTARSWQGRPVLSRPVVRAVVATYVVVGLAFTVVRNTPWGSALYAG